MMRGFLFAHPHPGLAAPRSFKLADIPQGRRMKGHPTSSVPAESGRTVPLPDELAVACLALGHVAVAFHGPARPAPAVSYDRSHAFRGVGRLMAVMAMQRVDQPITGFDDGVVPVFISD